MLPSYHLIYMTKCRTHHHESCRGMQARSTYHINNHGSDIIVFEKEKHIAVDLQAMVLRVANQRWMHRL